jgi:hypothetical protein
MIGSGNIPALEMSTGFGGYILYTVGVKLSGSRKPNLTAYLQLEAWSI